MTTNEPPTISELIAQLEDLQEKHGDVPVLCVEEVWPVYPTPEYKERQRWAEGEFSDTPAVWL